MNAESLVLLDTHIWVWLIEGSSQLASSKALPIIQKAGEEFKLRVSIISVWEVAMLEAKSRLRFSMPCIEWVKKALSAPGLSLAELTSEIAVESSRLPGSFHGDPADRMIIATSRQLGATLVTKDENILGYGACGFIRVLSV